MEKSLGILKDERKWFRTEVSFTAICVVSVLPLYQPPVVIGPAVFLSSQQSTSVAGKGSSEGAVDICEH